ncbi:Oidioi.mRNA.OKI2018_I69.PAR.g13173.t1.cds [Oikopleura dioica]|uniref:Oidioi.mRNA.OKI2018_I69.PAR.g13173.t1.cds n=1 Tax=Oikopleura dioica TaxID=34765 RepID=A0ABN7SBD8_OIKDI|nr:Oidioi.mRNA.OKI2018_I69.PAR.g13173.t1.cds [Oikopleura dioica]
MHNKEEDAKKSPRLDVWGFALILQEVLTLEHPFGRVDGRPALTGEILANIQTGKRTSLFEIFGETDEVEMFEVLLEKCTKVDRTERPRNAIELRNEAFFLEFLKRIENGEQASNIVPSPFPNENDEVERFKEEMRQKDRTIQELRNRLANFDEIKEENQKKAAIINQLQDRLNTFNEIMEDRLNEEKKQKEEALAAQNRFASAQEFEVAENGWNLKFRGGRQGYGGDGWHRLVIWSKDGGVRFKAVVQEIDYENGELLSRGEVTSEPDGQKQKIKSKYGDYRHGCFVRYNITLRFKLFSSFDLF